MKIETFFENFGILTDAPNAVTKLREIILQLAVCGKLFPQNFSDEPASVLLKKIKAEKENLVKEKKIREEKNLLKIKKDEIAYEVPQTWVLVRIGDVLNVIRGASPRPKGDPRYFAFERTPYHWVKISDIRKYSQGIFLENTDEFLTKEGADKSVVLEKGTLILTNSATIGVPVVLGIDGGCIHDGYLAFPYVNDNYLDKKYLYYYFLQFQSQLKERAFGGAQLNLNTNIVKNAPFALPPLAEQKRIVEKCDRLLSLCDQIEMRQQKRQESIVRMNESAINQLLSSQNPDEFSLHWQCICNNFDLLYSIAETIPKLRQAILQLAVQGKLVPQNINDESVLSLLDRIRFEREELVRYGKLAKLKNFSPVASDEIPYQLPKEWVWVPLGELLISSPRNGYSPKPVDYPTKVKTLTLSATTSGRFKNEYFKYLDEEIEQNSHLWLEDGDILIQRANSIEYVGIAAIYKGYSHEYIYPDLMMKLRSSNFLEKNYLHLAINNEISRNFLRARATGTSSNMPKINQLTVNSLPIPLPPLAEQKCIVAKVNRLMSLCDTLEAKLKEARSHSETLMEVAAKQVLVA